MLKEVSLFINKHFSIYIFMCYLHLGKVLVKPAEMNARDFVLLKHSSDWTLWATCLDIY